MNKKEYLFRILLIFILFSILTIIFTYPLFFKINTFIPGFESTDEPYGVLWGIWRHLNFYTFNLFGSEQIHLIRPTNYPILNLIIKYIAVLTNEIFAYNTIIISSFLLSGIFMFSLVYYFCKDIMAGILSGIIYAFCPYHFARTWQHMTLTQIQWFPLYCLAFFNLYKKANYRNILFCIGTFLIFVFTDYYYAYFGFLITLIFLLFIFLYNWKGKIKLHKFGSDIKALKSILLTMIIVFLLILPLVFPIIKTTLFIPKTELVARLGYKRSFTDLFEQSTRPLSYFLPAIAHPILGKFTEKFVGSSLYGKSLTEHTLYLGWTSLILAFIAFRKWRRKNCQGQSPKSGDSSYYREDFYIGFFVFLAIISWFSSQPPWWKIGPIKIYMPSFFLYKLLPMFRAYCRFGIVVMLAVAVLAGFGLKLILERFKSQKTKIVITFLFCGGVLFEFWNWPPYKAIDVSEVPAVYYRIKEQPGDFAIAEYPLDIEGPNEMLKFYQTKHEKKTINGPFPGTYAHKINQRLIKLSLPKTASVLKWLGVKYVVVHRDNYLKTGLVEQIEELNNISYNPGLKFIKTFAAQECPRKDIMCVQKTGPIDVYEVVAQSIKPDIK